VTAPPFHRDGLTLAVGAVGEGRPLVLQHGLCGDAAQVAEVAPPGWRTLALECRGHGGSDAGPSGRLSLATFAEDLAAFLSERVPTPAALGGLSMGAALALRLAVRRPELVRSLVLIRPAWVCEPAPPNLGPYAHCGDLLSRHPPEEAVAAFEASPLARRLAEDAPDNLASLRGILRREPVEVTRELLTRIAADGPGIAPSDLSALRVPTIVIGQDRDLAHPLAMAEELARLMPEARLMRVPPKADDRGRHAQAVRQAIALFLQELP
jgi:pimeloyl-ACP methyl ester carboxylesterase